MSFGYIGVKRPKDRSVGVQKREAHGHRVELNVTVLGDGGDSGGEAAGQTDRHVLDRGGTVSGSSHAS